MRLEKVASPRRLYDFLNLGRSVRAGDPNYHDSDSGLITAMLNGSISFRSHAVCEPVLVSDGERILARAMFIVDGKADDCMTVGFFAAARQAAAAVEYLLQEAKAFARKYDCRKIIVGINGHFAYGLGFLDSHFDEPGCFGFPNNPEYYHSFFRGLQKHEFSSYQIKPDRVAFDRERRLLGRVHGRGYTFRYADLSSLRREAAAYTAVNAKAYREHIFWASRTAREDYELFHSFSGYLAGENLILAEIDGETVGYLLWFPDYNQLARPGESTQEALRRQGPYGFAAIDRFRLAEIALLPEHQGTGAVLGLIEKMLSAVTGKYSAGEAGWIAADNAKSLGLIRRWEGRGVKEYKRYCVYEMMV